MAKNFEHISNIKSKLAKENIEDFHGLKPTVNMTSEMMADGTLPSPVKLKIPKLPTPDKLVYGEIAVNYLKGHETLSIKNSADEIVGFVNENEFNDMQEIVTSAFGKEKNERIESISNLESKMNSGIEDLELAISASLNDLNDRLLETFNEAEYDSNTKRINFKNGDDVKAYIDATDFIKDGMVSNVTISEGNLVITFNTDSGQDPISIPLTSIFNPDNYYDKTAVDGKLAEKADKTEIPTKTSELTNDSGFIIMADIPEGAAASTTTPLMDGVATVGTETAFARGDHRHPSDTSKANAADVYTKTEVDTELAKKANVTDVYTKQEIDTKFEESASDIEDMELVVSSSLNDLNSRIIANKDRLDSVDTTLETVNTGMESMFNGVAYDSESKRILFKNGNNVIGEVDATKFIKDGMVDSVEISEGNLVITFNTDAGHEDITIALTDIFNPANYYTKTEVDTALGNKADSSSVYTKSEADNLLDAKANSTDVYNKTQVDGFITEVNNAVSQKADASDSYTKSEIDGALALKADADSVYTKTEIDDMELTVSSSLNDLNSRILNNNGRLDAIDASITSINTKDSEQDAAIALKANTADMTTALDAKANTTDMNAALDLKANSADVYTKTAVDELFTTKEELETLTGDIEDMELVIASSLNDLNTRVIANGNDISENASALETINTTLANIQSTLTELTSRVETLEENLTSLTQRVSDLETNSTEEPANP